MNGLEERKCETEKRKNKRINANNKKERKWQGIEKEKTREANNAIRKRVKKLTEIFRKAKRIKSGIDWVNNCFKREEGKQERRTLWGTTNA